MSASEAATAVETAAVEPSTEETGPVRVPNPWPARCALVAAAGLVVGGLTYGTVAVAAALTPPAPAASPESAGSEAREDGDSERRTVSLLPDPAEEAEASQETADTEGPGGSDAAADPGPGTASGGAGTSGGTSGGTGGAAPEGGVDPREEILEGILNSPQPRPPIVNEWDQERLDEYREQQEDAVVPEVVEPDPEDYAEFYDTPHAD
ncbi:hypothetical protein [Nocardiopsis deserti]|uniref:hypothetical protein n=1 Tax=Nocardiopsis deserti TaxID=2605988 RepID=UPI00123C34A5|nr:hypothetical protein [Nocardiopsis deserti]